eukprot:s7922_g3.t1
MAALHAVTLMSRLSRHIEMCHLLVRKEMRFYEASSRTRGKIFHGGRPFSWPQPKWKYDINTHQRNTYEFWLLHGHNFGVGCASDF